MGDVIEVLTTATNTVEVAATGPQGAPGVGVPTGGSALQVLRKVSSTDYDTEWAAAASGSGSVTSVALAGTGLSISGSPITTSGTITANVAYGTTAGTACEGNDGRISNLTSGVLNSISQPSLAINGPVGIAVPEFSFELNAEENFITFSAVPLINGAIVLREGDLAGQLVLNANGTNAGAFTGGTGGSVDVRGGNALSPGGNGGNGGSINLRGGDAEYNQGEAGEPGGSIDLSGSNFGGGGSINLSSSGNGNGGSIDMSAGGGSLITSLGGGSIDTRGTGSIELGVSGTRTTLTGTATAARAISLPNASGTLALTSDFAAPPAIGSTTPAAGTFTTLAATGTLHTFGVSNPASDTTIELYGAGAANRLHKIIAAAGAGIVFQTGTTVPSGPCMQSGGNLRLAANSFIRWSNNANSSSVGGDSIEIARDADDTLALRRSTAAQTLNVYGTYTSATNFQRLAIKTKAVTLSALSGASVATTTGLIPDGAVLVGLTTRVSTAITGATGYDIGDGSDADRWGANVAIALNTSSDNTNWTAGTIECFTAAQEVTLTAVGSNFTGGAVVIVAHYLAGEAD
jgi:hypothetical protein